MNQTPYFIGDTPVGVGFFHKFFPPVNSIGINPNPTHSNPREIRRNFLLECIKIPSLLVSSPLVYTIRDIATPYLTTVSRDCISPSHPLDAPADNYNNEIFNLNEYNKSYIESYKKSVTFGSMGGESFGC